MDGERIETPRSARTHISALMESNPNKAYCIHQLVRITGLDQNLVNMSIRKLEKEKIINMVGKAKCSYHPKKHFFYQIGPRDKIDEQIMAFHNEFIKKKEEPDYRKKKYRKRLKKELKKVAPATEIVMKTQGEIEDKIFEKITEDESLDPEVRALLWVLGRLKEEDS